MNCRAAALLALVAWQSPIPKAANIVTGRVTDLDGKPVAGVGVTLVERSVQRGIARFHPANVQIRAATNERGEYRIEFARLGEFFVVAMPANTGRGPDGLVNRIGYAVTYHPSALHVTAAKPVLINVREPQVADIVLQPAKLAVVSGTVIDSKGAPVTSGRVSVSRGDNLFGADTGGFELRGPSFSLGGLNPGTYFLRYSEGPWPPPLTLETPLISGAKVVVDGADVTNVRVAPIQMVRASGRVTVAAEDRAALMALQPTVAGVPIISEGNPGPTRAGRLQDDLTFSFRAWPAQGTVRTSAEGRGFRIKAIRHDGVDVTDKGVEFREGQEITGLEIELVRGG